MKKIIIKIGEKKRNQELKKLSEQVNTLFFPIAPSSFMDKLKYKLALFFIYNIILIADRVSHE